MRLLLTFVPLNDYPFDRIYKHTLQGFLYSFLKQTSFADYHDRATFKFFCFSDIFPIGDFNEGVRKNLLVSSPNRDLISAIKRSVSRGSTYNLSGLKIRIIRVKPVSLRLKNRFTTGSPIVLYKDNKRNLYYSFQRDKDLSFFLERLKENALKKYNAFYREDYILNENIFDRLVFRKDVAVKNVKDDREFIIIGSAWRLLEKFHIPREDRKFYEFIMDCGLGEKNSFGFGFVNPLK